MLDRDKSVLALACIGLLASCGDAPVGPPTTQPNLLMITFDTLRADHLGAYGNLDGLTPNFDQLAAESIKFTNAYAVSSTTGPSHATIFSGLYPNEHGVLKNGVMLSDDVVTIAEVLRDNGYSTAAFVSSYIVKSDFGWVQGFDKYDEHYNFARRRWGGLTVDAASEWIADQPNDKPWCVWVHFMDPHKPYKQPAEYLEPYITSELSCNDLDMASYKGAVAYMDSVLPKLINTISSQEAGAGTLMAITSDHGELFGEHGHYGHGGGLYEDTQRAPLIFKHTSLKPQQIDTIVGLVDYTPTVLDMLNIDAGTEMSGKSLRPMIDGSDATMRTVFMQRRIFDESSVEQILAETGANVSGSQWSVIDGDYKLILAPEANEVQLFNLNTDPQELDNVAETDSVQLRKMRVVLSAILDAQTLRVSATELSDEVLQNLEQLGYAK